MKITTKKMVSKDIKKTFRRTNKHTHLICFRWVILRMQTFCHVFSFSTLYKFKNKQTNINKCCYYGKGYIVHVTLTTKLCNLDFRTSFNNVKNKQHH